MSLTTKPACVFKNTGALHTGVVCVPNRNRVKNKQVVFSFENVAAYDAFKKKLAREIYPTLASSMYRSLALFMFGRSVLRRSNGTTQVSLTRAQLRQLANGRAVNAKVAQAKAAGQLPKESHPPSTVALIARVARFLVNAKDHQGRTAFSLFDIDSRNPSSKPLRNGRIEGMDAAKMFVHTHSPSSFIGG